MRSPTRTCRDCGAFPSPGVRRELPPDHGPGLALHLDPLPHLRPPVLLWLRARGHYTALASTVVVHLRRRERVPGPLGRQLGVAMPIALLDPQGQSALE